MLLANRGYDADWIRELARQLGRAQAFRRNAIAKTRSASARICIARATWSNGSSQDQSASSVRDQIWPARSQLSGLRQARIHPHLAAS